MPSSPRKYLTVFCTELAALAGRHRYRSVDDAVGQFLGHNEPIIFADFPHLRDQLRDVRMKDAVARRQEYQCRKRHADVLDKALEQLDAAGTPEEARLALDEQLAAVGDPAERETLRSMVFKTRGVQTEPTTLDEYQRMTGRSLKDRNTEFRTSKVMTTPGGVPYRIGGRLDAVCDSLQRVVEVKTRMNKFFLPDYDIVQVYGYFAITGLKSCDFLQTLCGALQTDVIEYDESVWLGVREALEATLDRVLCVKEGVSEVEDADEDGEEVVLDTVDDAVGAGDVQDGVDEGVVLDETRPFTSNP